MALTCRGALCPCNRPVLAGIKARVMDRAGLDRRQNRTCGQGLYADLTGCVIPALRVMLLSCSPPLTPLLPSGQSLASHGLPGCGGFAPAVFCTPASITKPVAALFACVRRPLHESPWVSSSALGDDPTDTRHHQTGDVPSSFTPNRPVANLVALLTHHWRRALRPDAPSSWPLQMRVLALGILFTRRRGGAEDFDR